LKLTFNSKISIVFLLLTITLSQSAFGEIDEDVIIEDIIVNKFTIYLICTDPILDEETEIKKYKVKIAEDEDFESVDITDKSDKICDGETLNSIDISSLEEDTDYFIKLTVKTNDDGKSVEIDEFTTLETEHFEVELEESLSITDEIIAVQIQQFEIILTETLSLSDMIIVIHVESTDSFVKTLTNSMSISDVIIVLVNSQQVESNGGGDSDYKWRSMPTFGMDNNILYKQIVENGLIVNERQITITDNFHMEYPMQELETGELHTLTAKAFSERGLKMVEFMFGVPEVGKHYKAEATVEIWLDHIDPLIIINQKANIIRDDVMALTTDVKCNQQDPTMCESITVFLMFNESPLSTVFSIQAIDLAGRNIITTLNHGIDVTGESLNPPKTDYMAQGKNGLVLMIQQDNQLWIDPNEILYTKNSAESWIRVSPVKMPIVQDDWKVEERHISYWKEKLLYEAAKAKYSVFDSAKIQKGG